MKKFTTLPESHDDDETLSPRPNEQLNGQVKTQWAQKYKFDSDLALENSIGLQKRVFAKRLTKGTFNPEYLTNAGNWMKDK